MNYKSGSEHLRIGCPVVLFEGLAAAIQQVSGFIDDSHEPAIDTGGPALWGPSPQALSGIDPLGTTLSQPALQRSLQPDMFPMRVYALRCNC